MTDPRTARLAQVMVSYCIDVQPGQRIALYGSPKAEPLLRELYREVLHAGGYPYPFLGFEVYPSYGGFDDIFFKEANEDQLKHVFETDRMVRSSFEGMIVLQSNRNTRSLAGISPEQQRIRNAAYAGLQKIFLERTFEGSFRWVQGMYPTSALAQEAERDLEFLRNLSTEPVVLTSQTLWKRGKLFTIARRNLSIGCVTVSRCESWDHMSICHFQFRAGPFITLQGSTTCPTVRYSLPQWRHR